jgi:hypothetical protein
MAHPTSASGNPRPFMTGFLARLEKVEVRLKDVETRDRSDSMTPLPGAQVLLDLTNDLLRERERLIDQKERLAVRNEALVHEKEALAKLNQNLKQENEALAKWAGGLAKDKKALEKEKDNIEKERNELAEIARGMGNEEKSRETKGSSRPEPERQKKRRRVQTRW